MLNKDKISEKGFVERNKMTDAEGHGRRELVITDLLKFSNHNLKLLSVVVFLI